MHGRCTSSYSRTKKDDRFEDKTPDYATKCLIPIPTNLGKFSRYPCVKSRQICPKLGVGLWQIPTKTMRRGRKFFRNQPSEACANPDKFGPNQPISVPTNGPPWEQAFGGIIRGPTYIPSDEDDEFRRFF
ncbi:hypothetical protein B0H11DRAFT_1917048 [Mycena galericulata]|nr:hypothetical protein B0H11DRAFT_1917048 [Mycena galericulata]